MLITLQQDRGIGTKWFDSTRCTVFFLLSGDAASTLPRTTNAAQLMKQHRKKSDRMVSYLCTMQRIL